VAGLRETVEGRDEEHNTPQPAICKSPEPSSATYAILFKQAQLRENGHAHHPNPSKNVRNIFLRLYHQRVDCLYKILHWPTVCAQIERQHGKPQDPRESNPIMALELSIYFTAICSISDDEARDLGLGNRSDLMEQYLSATETAISEADLLRHPNVTLLQAFAIYLV
jgi:hypothetical protein